jgi:DNA-binding NtrC family response regulator
LLYRINTIELYIPPLRERGNDIQLLSEFFLNKYCTKYKKHIKGITSEIRSKLESYNWPGNVRELQNALERAVILSSGNRLNVNDFIFQTTAIRKKDVQETFNLQQIEQATIDKAMVFCQGNVIKAAELLGITRFALYRKIKK